ncbi:hypothetical protein Q671_02585 [Halomonas sp. PBN3]|nr:hypothetical protein Q671_02585 [Halomonas sp. PBN3]
MKDYISKNITNLSCGILILRAEIKLSCIKAENVVRYTQYRIVLADRNAYASPLQLLGCFMQYRSSNFFSLTQHLNFFGKLLLLLLQLLPDLHQLHNKNDRRQNEYYQQH